LYYCDQKKDEETFGSRVPYDKPFRNISQKFFMLMVDVCDNLGEHLNIIASSCLLYSYFNEAVSIPCPTSCSGIKN
jgi:hypothetical protein